MCPSCNIQAKEPPHTS